MPYQLLGLNGSDNLWHLQSGTNPNNLTIPYSDLSEGLGSVRVRNIHFGDAYSKLTVSCKDDIGNGNIHTAAKTGIKIYFPTNRDLYGKTVTPRSGVAVNKNTPLWYIFWKEGGVVDLLNITNYQFINTGLDGNGITLGNSLPPATINISWPILLLEGTVRTQTEATDIGLTSTTFSYGSVGFHARRLIGTIFHEKYHNDAQNVWKAFPNNVIFTHSDSDWIPDDEEQNPSRSSYPGGSMFVRSKTNNADTYNLQSISSDYSLYEDQEMRCRILEFNVTQFDNSDWKNHYFPNQDWSDSPHNPNFN